MSSSDDFQIKALGPCRIASPLKNVLAADAQQKMFVRHDDHVWITPDMRSGPDNAKAGFPAVNYSRRPSSVRLLSARMEFFGGQGVPTVRREAGVFQPVDCG